MIDQIKSLSWRLLTDVVPNSAEKVVELLLQLRQIKDAEQFFNPPHPAELSAEDVAVNITELQAAVARILVARENKEKVIIFGDYDADGVCATAILWQTLHALGVAVLPFIPEREKHGYGISEAALTDILAAGRPDLIITVDNGIVAHAPLSKLADLGIDVVVTDHHQPESALPPAVAIVHTAQLCGASVAWLLARELCLAAGTSLAVATGSDQLDLAGLATIADLVPLQGANRSFAAHGLTALRATSRPGLLALYTQASLDTNTLSEGTVGYAIAPRINAMGRIGSSLDALRLLCTTSAGKAASLARLLEQTNNERRTATEEAVSLALEQAATQVDEKLIVVSSDQFAEGVIGLVAGRLVDEFYKPVVVFATGNKLAKGSARSVKGVNITELLREQRELLLSVGGHPLAAGCSVAFEKLPTLIQALQKRAQLTITAEQLTPHLTVDLKLPLSLLTAETFQLLEKSRPFGMGNRTPVFLIEITAVSEVKLFGRENNHLRFELPLPGRESVKVVAWQQAEQLNIISETTTTQPTQAVIKFVSSSYAQHGFELQLLAAKK